MKSLLNKLIITRLISKSSGIQRYYCGRFFYNNTFIYFSNICQSKEVNIKLLCCVTLNAILMKQSEQYSRKMNNRLHFIAMITEVVCFLFLPKRPLYIQTITPCFRHLIITTSQNRQLNKILNYTLFQFIISNTFDRNIIKFGFTKTIQILSKFFLN